MEGEPINLEASESKSKKAKPVKVTRGLYMIDIRAGYVDIIRKPSERIMKKTSFSKFTNVESDPIILDFDSDYSAPRLANPLPQNPKKTYHTGVNEISDTHSNMQYQRRTKHKNESSCSRVPEHQHQKVSEEVEFPKKRTIIDDNTNNDVPPKLRRVQPRMYSTTPKVTVSKPELKNQARTKDSIQPVTKKKNLKQNIPAPIAPQTQSDNLLIRTSPKPLFETLHSLSNPLHDCLKFHS
ncbi:hypothetical protein L2E82_39383 [Cichorium intybus]|uniref:Uncharacterized protein n=1 Tax=Cichorium intybus TaxID=13427 RepID=A0ACB9AIB4_CICIN|nr:hypothetical protein L2E82_39383 [Cichorium intybus]